MNWRTKWYLVSFARIDWLIRLLEFSSKSFECQYQEVMDGADKVDVFAF